MWCAHCQAEVAAEVASDNRRVRCANCGTQLPSGGSAAITDKTREARELLERWSSRPSFAAAATTAPRAEQRAAEKPPVVPLSLGSLPKSGRSVLRRDDGHAGAFAPQPTAADTTDWWPETPRTRAGATPPRSEPLPEVHVPAPHFGRQPARARPTSSRANWTSAFGQLLAYAGVLGLTVGTTLVLWGYFGGGAYQSYTPTGWLIATLGQMLMFLGVMTVVSGGMEQTRSDVSRSIESLGDQLLRIEQSSREHTLRGPSIAAEQFDDAAKRPARERAASYAMNAR